MIAFESFKAKLRDAGCEVLTDDQWPAGHGRTCNLLRIYRPEKGFPLRCLVIDMRAEGYQLFIESAALKIDDDVARIMAQ